jgi:AmmeMemoRadiSam system radical SAM enzyme/AmmeMemoRadiSam system protein B/AmmeMemoRadiSam system protein A
LRPGDRGFCFVRENVNGQMHLSTYGRSTGFCIDPIEKKPLNHFYPGTSVLSFGTAGCNLGCKFCQNWSISKSRELEQLSEEASPATIAAAAERLGCRSVAFTYNDPVIWAEYAIDTARACRAAGIKTVAVTAGYITPAARPAFFQHMDATNVDLKAFTEEFYHKITLSHLQPVLDTLRWLKEESETWLEITNLIIPDANDSRDEVRQMCDWLLNTLGPDVPIHFTAFHPDFRLRDRSATRAETLLAAYDLARSAGLHFPYVGNVQAIPQQTTYCPGCGQAVIERAGYEIRRYALTGNQCNHCQRAIPGHFDASPGHWGSRRQPVRISQFAAEAQPTPPHLPTSTAPTMSRPHSAADSELLQFTTHVLRAAVLRQPTVAEHGLSAETATRSVLGTFVSLKREGNLRSCCGSLGPPVPLQASLVHSAQRAATDDPRFPPIAADELPYLNLDVWLLTNQQAVTVRGESRREIVEIGKHGLQIARGNDRGLLLPGVALDHELDAEEFLAQVCRKAGLPPHAWKDETTELWTFEGTCLSSPLHSWLTAPALPEPPIRREELLGLVNLLQGNLIAAATGATPTYVAPGVADGNVLGVVVSAEQHGQSLGRAVRLNLRESLPLQATLFQIAQQLGEALRRTPGRFHPSEPCRVDLAILNDTMPLGTLPDVDWRGFDAARHTLVVMQRQRTGLAFDRTAEPGALLTTALSAADIAPSEPAAVFSLTTVASSPQFVWGQAPQSSAGARQRPAAQAGRFYPAQAEALRALVDDCLAGPAVRAQACSAILVPHAGLIYSGRVAADVWRRTRLPERVLIIGPKHTHHGVDWAVAPHESWSLPGGSIAADPELAALLSERVAGWQIDAAAHAQEHAIEVELPFLHRLAPQTKVTGVALGPASLPQCLQFAQGLAAVLRSLREPPLLVISSDMNHFASEAENRRLDRLALQALATLDPAALYQTIRQHQISMCGVVPAVIVLETLRLLNRVQSCAEISYATSAEVSGDSSRVVGYAGVQFLPH